MYNSISTFPHVFAPPSASPRFSLRTKNQRRLSRSETSGCPSLPSSPSSSSSSSSSSVQVECRLAECGAPVRPLSVSCKGCIGKPHRSVSRRNSSLKAAPFCNASRAIRHGTRGCSPGYQEEGGLR